MSIWCFSAVGLGMNEMFPFCFEKMVGLYKDPEGEHIFESPAGAVTTAFERKQSSAAAIELLGSDQQKVEWLTLRVQELEKELSLTQVSHSSVT